MLSLFNTNNVNTSAHIGGILNIPIVGNIVSNFTNKLTNNYGVPGDKASGIENSLIPSVISNLVKRTNDPNNNSFANNRIIGSISGGENP